VVQSQFIHCFSFAAVLAAVLVAHVNSQALHSRCFAAASHVDVDAAPDHGRHAKFRSHRPQHSLAVKLFNRDGIFKSHDYRSGDADGAERLISLIEK
jgi:hypothetical protein